MDISNPVGGIGWQSPSTGNTTNADALSGGDDWFEQTDFASMEPISPSAADFPIGASIDHILQATLSFIVQPQG